MFSLFICLNVDISNIFVFVYSKIIKLYSNYIYIYVSFLLLSTLAELKMLQIEAVMEAAAHEEKQMRQLQSQELKENWDAAIQYKNSRPVSPNLDPQKAGPSAAQVFQGEDRHYLERVSKQREQMRSWIQEAVTEKAHIKQLNTDNDEEYAAIQRQVDAAREAAEIEEKAVRRYLNQSVKMDNDKLSIAQRESRRRMMSPLAEVPKEELYQATSLNILNETPADACDENGKILRRDMFKGYTESQRKRIWMENERCRQQKL